MTPKTLKTACAYYRTSSATNVGEDKDSQERQAKAVRTYAARHGIEIVHEYYDAAVSGADPVADRKGFGAMLAYMLGNGARMIIVETANRFARDLIVQETGYMMLKAKGIQLVAVDSPESFISDTPTAVMVRQILGSVSQFEKAMVVDKLRGARDRKSAKLGHRVEGAKHLGRIPPEHTRAAVKAAEQGLSLREISAHLASLGLLAQSGKAYGASAVRTMLKRGN